jgi:hypothetical protein
MLPLGGQCFGTRKRRRGPSSPRESSQDFLGEEQIAKGDDDHGNREIGNEDADTGQVVTDPAELAKLTVFHCLTFRRLDYRPPGGERVGTLGDRNDLSWLAPWPLAAALAGPSVLKGWSAVGAGPQGAMLTEASEPIKARGRTLDPGATRFVSLGP